MKIIEKVPYAFMVESLIYVMVCTRMVIAYAVGSMSRFLANLGKEYWQAVKLIMRYLKGISECGLCF